MGVEADSRRSTCEHRTTHSNQELIMRLQLILALLMAGSLAPAFLQEPQKRPTDTGQTTTPGQASTSRNQSTDKDGFLAGWILVDLRNGMALAQLGQEKAQDPEVKRFAQQMVEDHRKLAEQIRPYVGAGFSTSTSIDTGRTPSGTSSDGQGRDDSKEGRDFSKDVRDFKEGKAMLIEELGQQCFESARKELQDHTAADFDRCFVGMAYGGHMKANDMLVVFQRHATGDFKQKLDAARSTVSMHMDQAKELMRKFAGKP